MLSMNDFTMRTELMKEVFYEGISRDLEKLPHYVEHGSRAQCLDTGDIYTFHKKLDMWFKL